MKKRTKFLPLEEEVEEDVPFSDLTEDFYSFLEIPKEEIFKDSSEERVKQILIIIAGTMGIGKTTLVENIIKRIQDYYGEDKVNAVITRENTEVLLEYAFRGNPERGWDADKPIQVIAFDDITAVKLSVEDQRSFCSLRHRMIEETGRREGIIYSILVTHDWYRLDPNFRRNALITCFLSVSPLDLYSRRAYSHFIGEEGVRFLSERLGQAIRFDEEKGTGLVVLPLAPTLGEEEERVGLIRWSKVKGVKYVIIKKHRIRNSYVFKFKEV